MKRKIIQFLFTIINNSYILFPFTKRIYQGNLKYICSPGLNCYSCPASVFACPIGALQNIFASIRVSLSLGKFQIGLYVLGFLGIIGALSGRIVCGWVCPFGLLQELLYKIPSKKIKLNYSFLRYLKFAILCILVILLPIFLIDKFGYGESYFCKYLCPAGTLEAGLSLPFLIPSLKDSLGWLYSYKLFILGFFIIFFIISKRPFCRFFCPLGAIYALFNKFSLINLSKNEEKCNKCNICVEICPMELSIDEIPNSIDCIRCFNCVKVCPTNAIFFLK